MKMENKIKLDSLEKKIFRAYLFSYIFIYIIVVSFCIATSIQIKNIFYSITMIIIVLLLTVSPIIYLFYIDKILHPLKKINYYLSSLKTFQYYKKKEYTDIEDYRLLLDEIYNLSNILEETKLNYERYKLRINSLNKNKEFVELQEKDLIYSISHELKTPISIIEAGAYAILDGIYEGEDEKHELEQIIYQCQLSISMIQDVLNVFKLSRSDFKITKTTFLLKDLVNEKIKSFNDLFQKYNHKLIVNLDDASIYADRDQISTVLSNVIQNAITNSPHGSEIIINIKKIGKETIFEITNTNVNIPEEKIAHIFEPFVKLDESHTKKEYKGNGLGLYITKQILSKFNFDYGIVNVENGVKFYFIALEK